MFKKAQIALFILLCLSTTAFAEIKAVIFDFGGVIANVDRSQLTNFLKDSFPISEEEANKLLQAWHTDINEGKDEKQFWNHYAVSVNSSLSPDWLSRFEKVQENALRPFPEMLAAIQQLKRHGYRVGLLSNVTPQHAAIIRKLGYYNLFDPLLLSCDIGVRKPDPKAFEIMLKALSPLQPQEVLFVDDQKVNTDAAEKLGIQVIHLLRPQNIFCYLQEKGINLAVLKNLSRSNLARFGLQFLKHE